MAGADEEDDDFPATQPVMSVLLSGVVAYVEVRSGHDNRSKGVKAHMRSLGATIQETLNRKVTHVVFNEGLPSTYKKAKKFKCHLVSVLWIEACKEALTKVSEAGYPPIGQQIYENPDSIKNFKKMKSMQPDSDDDAVEMKTKKRLKRMARRQHKNKLATVPDASEESDEDGTKKTSPPKVHEQPGNETSKKSTRSKAIRKKPALQEITPEVVNKSAVCEASGANSAKTGTTQNMKPLLAAHAQGCSTLPQNKAGLPGKKSTKSKKLPDNSPITRREFIEGLNDICLSLPSDSDMDKSDVSPWRKSVGPPPVKIRRKNPPAKKVSPRRSPRHASDSSDCFLFPAVPARRSPRHVTGIVKISKKEPDQSAQKPSACTSASAALLRKKMPVPPSSPGDDFVLLSQEPGDMPSIDEMAKMRRGSVRAGNERITLSQIIRSYNAVAQEGPESAASTSARSRSASLVSDKNLMKDGCNSPRTMEDTIVVDVEDDAACDMEVRSCVSRCSSEAGSTVSSTSTRVLINGNPSSQVGCSSSYLPSSGTVDDDGKVCTAEEPEREPSPIFVIKKSKFRRPLKKQFNATKQSSENQSMDKNMVSLSNIKNKDVSSSAEERRPSLNPIDYINKLLLPKFMPVDRTPGNAHMGTVIVEDTPELVSSSNSKTECHCVIPPTPVGNQEPVASPNQSLTSSVISWVKKSCRVPLFSSHSKKAMATTPTIQNRNQNSPKEMAINPGVSSQDSAATIYYSFSKETGNAPEESENPLADLTSFVRSSQVSSKNSNSPLKINQPSPRHSISEKKLTNENSPNNVNKSLGEQQSAGKSICKKNKTPPAISKKGEILQDQAVQNGSKSKASSLSKKTKVLKPRGKVIVTVVKNDEGVSNSGCDAKTDTASLTPVIQINKAQEAHCSSGYETSNSIASDTDTAGTNKNRSEASDKRKKITDWLSPISGPPKKQSDIYEYESPASRDTDKSTDTMLPQRRGGRKRIQSVPDKSSKKPKLNSSESDITPGSRRTRASRVDGNNVLTESRSDLSTDSTKSSGRKSSEEAKKRMAVSLTRNYKSHALKVIVCTFLTASEQNGIDVAGTKLGGWKLEEKVTPRTTHVINSGPKRTLNMLKGLSRGCWLVDQQWMLDSAKAGTWLDEEKYELTKFSPGVKLCRMKRQAIGKEYKHNLFARSGPIFVSPKSDGPPAKDIRELLELCGADLTTSMQEAKIVVGGEPSLKGTLNCVRPQWVLDSITRNKVLPMNDPDYQIK